LVFDIEVWIDWDYIYRSEIYEEFERSYEGPPLNFKDPVKIAAHHTDWWAKKRKAWTFSPMTAKVCSIAWGDLWEDEVHAWSGYDESEIIQEFAEAIWGMPQVLTGYYIRGFDVPFIQTRASVLGIALPPWWPNKHDYRGIADIFDVTTEGKLDKWLERCGLPLKTGDGSLVEYMPIEEIEAYNRNDVVVERELARRFAPNMPNMRGTKPVSYPSLQDLTI